MAVSLQGIDQSKIDKVRYSVFRCGDLNDDLITSANLSLAALLVDEVLSIQLPSKLEPGMYFFASFEVQFESLDSWVNILEPNISGLTQRFFEVGSPIELVEPLLGKVVTQLEARQFRRTRSMYAGDDPYAANSPSRRAVCVFTNARIDEPHFFEGFSILPIRATFSSASYEEALRAVTQELSLMSEQPDLAGIPKHAHPLAALVIYNLHASAVEKAENTAKVLFNDIRPFVGFSVESDPELIGTVVFDLDGTAHYSIPPRDYRGNLVASFASSKIRDSIRANVPKAGSVPERGVNST